MNEQVNLENIAENLNAQDLCHLYRLEMRMEKTCLKKLHEYVERYMFKKQTAEVKQCYSGVVWRKTDNGDSKNEVLNPEPIFKSM